jgi:hypothetical protein
MGHTTTKQGRKDLRCDDLQLPEPIRRQIEHMLSLGYPRRHLVITPEGTVLFDPEAADYDAHMRVFHEGRNGSDQSS